MRHQCLARYRRSTRPPRFALCALLVGLPVMMSGCAGIKWPFGGDEAQERRRTPANAVAYECAGGKRFYVRSLDNGAAAWVILPERAVRLDKVVPAGEPGSARYSNGIAVLDVRGDEASLSDGPAVAYAGCKLAT